MIELKDVSKKYNRKVVLENVNLKIKDGEVTAFVGHNGSGKSTLLKAISDLVRIDHGEIIYDRNYRFSYVPEKFPVINLSAIDFLKHMAEIDGIYSKNERMARIYALTKDFYMENMLDKPIKNLSKGTLQKVGDIQALMSEPELIHALADRVYSIHGCKISPYEKVPQTTYVIWMSADTSLTPAPEMKKQSMVII